ncbi:hypothetical protein [Pseudonocardia phyllosphaerae]|uniref:hypothetical protein n=1 Tax=Pseudonocardia phyllosphaerae TaxID=3390502 RepID=UPI00397A4E23
MTRALVRSTKVVLLLLTTLLATVLAAGAASAAPQPGPPAPGPVRDLTVAIGPGSGARGSAFDASWTQPATGPMIEGYYRYEVTDALGKRVDAGRTDDTRAGTFHGDYCRAPYTFTVRAVSVSGRDGAETAGPPASASYGSAGSDACALHSTLAAKQTGPGAVDVTITSAQTAPVEVSGDCVLNVDGKPVWSGTCGGYKAKTAHVTGLEPGTHGLILVTKSPNGITYTDRGTATVR